MPQPKTSLPPVPIVLLGGLGVRKTAWSDLLLELENSELTGPIYARELNDFSTAPADYHTTVKALGEFLATLPAPAYLVGHSMAGLLVEAVAYQFPAHVRGYCLLDASLAQPPRLQLPTWYLSAITRASKTKCGRVAWYLFQFFLTFPALRTISRRHELARLQAKSQCPVLDTQLWANFGPWSAAAAKVRGQVLQQGCRYPGPVQICVCERGRGPGAWTRAWQRHRRELARTCCGSVRLRCFGQTPHLIMRSNPRRVAKLLVQAVRELAANADS